MPTGHSAGLGVSSDSSWNTNPPHRSAEDHRRRQTRWLRILYNEAATWGRSWASTWCQREQVTGLMQKNVWGWGVSASTYKNKIFPCVGATRPCGISRAHYRGKQQYSRWRWKADMTLGLSEPTWKHLAIGGGCWRWWWYCKSEQKGAVHKLECELYWFA